MKIIKTLKLSLVATSLAATSALANGTVPAAMPNQPAQNGSAISIYVGFGAGFQHQRGKRRDLLAPVAGNVAPSLAFSNKTRLNASSPNASVHLGLAWRASNAFSIGLEPYYSYSKLSSTASGAPLPLLGILYSNRISSKSAFGLDLKPTYNINDNSGVFLLLGLECRSFKLDHFNHSNVLGNVIAATARKSMNMRGFSYGLGYEHAMGKSIVGMRVKYTRYNKKTIAARDTNNTNVSSAIKPNNLTAMLTFSYRIM